jgi:hypothetical protein
VLFPIFVKEQHPIAFPRKKMLDIYVEFPLTAQRDPEASPRSFGATMNSKEFFLSALLVITD